MSKEARYPELENQSIIVTGGTRGIGLGIVRVLARAGARITITGRKQEGLDALTSELSDQGVAHVVMQANQGDPEAATQVVERAISAFGQVDGLVANAQSYLPVKTLLEIDSRDFDYVLDTGPKGTLWLMQAVHPHMKTQSRGRIVTFGSSMGNTGAPGYGPYSAAKEAMRSLTRTAAREWGKDGITVNCVCPASVAHRMKVVDPDSPRGRAFAAMYDDHPLGRDGDAEADIAPVVAFLLSNASQYMTGQTYMIDGGGIMRA
jgi:NAD(P)-dependent dehydrogenase (short-subunit alcohol dehydrogenase family)